MGLSTGLARPICARSVGLDNTLWGPQLSGRVPLRPEGVTTGEGAPELGSTGIEIGCGRGTRLFPLGVRGANSIG